eukprot:13472917-Alexandrium_andersonii.AAC.1
MQPKAALRRRRIVQPLPNFRSIREPARLSIFWQTPAAGDPAYERALAPRARASRARTSALEQRLG